MKDLAELYEDGTGFVGGAGDVVVYVFEGGHRGDGNTGRANLLPRWRCVCSPVFALGLGGDFWDIVG